MLKRFFSAIWRGITLLRLALANLVFIALLVILWTVFSTGKPAPLPERAALLLDLDGTVVDQRSEVDAASLLIDGETSSREMLLTDLIDSVDYAAADDRIVALVFELSGLRSMGQSKILELAPAIERFRATGKPVVAVADYYTQDQYRLAVEADTILMHPFGGVALEGFGYYINYYAEALEKLAVSMHVFRAGEFKSIAEPLLRSDMSPGERAVSREWLSDLWALYTEAVEERRGLAKGSVNTLLNDYSPALAEVGGSVAQLALAQGLVDDLLDRHQQDAYLRALVGATGTDGRFAAIDFADYLPLHRQAAITPGMASIAVVTAQGNMLPGEHPPGTIGADTLVRVLRDTAALDSTRAIVLRVNSPGGSVFAAEIIREELARIRDGGMPVVVSMGAAAASGGYYIASAADRIIATPATITGSIGVFLAFPTFEKLLARGGIYTDGFGTTEMAGRVRLDRALSEELARSLQLGVDHTYEQFAGLVMQSRGISRPALDELAEGRVLSAEDAMAGGLVDALGSLDDAVSAAAEIAGLGDQDYEVLMMGPSLSPRQQFLQQLSESLGVQGATQGVMQDFGRGVAQKLRVFALPALQGWLAPVDRGLGLIESLQDPQNLYMRCLACDID